MHRTLLVLALALSSCSSDGTATSATSEAPAPEPSTPEAQVDAMNAGIEALMAREEHDAELVVVQHVLVSYAGVQGLNATRSREEAEVLAARILADIEAGLDFGVLMREHSDDPGPGIYPMRSDASPNHPRVRPRSGMVPGFGAVGWRLQVGEVGVAPPHDVKSPFGWHVIQRTE